MIFEKILSTNTTNYSLCTRYSAPEVDTEFNFSYVYLSLLYYIRVKTNNSCNSSPTYQFFYII